MFYGTTFLNADLSLWDVSNVTDMSSMFSSSKFNGDISNWVVSKVTDMEGMFSYSPFNGDISNWDVSKVTDMDGMFREASAFNSDISTWDVSEVTNMSYMFFRAQSFQASLSTWNVSNVTNMAFMFYYIGRTHNTDLNISNWDVSSVTNMAFMFALTSTGSTVFDNWDVSKVTNMSNMFSSTTGFFLSSRFSNWDVSNAENMSYMFYNTSFNQDLSNWDVSKVSNMEDMFLETNFSKTNYDKTLIKWAALPTVPSNINLGDVPANYCSGSDARSYLINNKGWTFNDQGVNCSQNFITTWQTTTANETIKVPMSGTYTINWGDGSVETRTNTATHTYATANTYTVSIGYGPTKIDFYSEPDSKDKIIAITQWGDLAWGSDLSNAFYNCTHLNITASDTPVLNKTTDLSYMFYGATSLKTNSIWLDNTKLFYWDVSKVTNMDGMFREASAFNSNISNWDVSKVTNMEVMFRGAIAFNSDISNWDVSNVRNMTTMFQDAYNFNFDISNWDISKVSWMGYMFLNASNFNQNLSSWDISDLNFALDMFNNTAISATNYDKTLIGWATLANVPSNINLGNVPVSYCAGATAKATLVAKGWSFNDGGLSSNCNSWTGTTDTDWAKATNWSSGSLPIATNTVVIPDVTNKPIINTNTTVLAEDLTLLKNATLAINTGGGLTVNGDFYSTDTNALTAHSGSSVIVSGTSNNNIQYNRNLPTTNWYLVASPVGNETIENFISTNNLATGSTNMGVTNIGLAPYNNAVASNNWSYQNINSVGTLNSGQGYSVKLAAPGDISFSGIVNATSQTQTLTQGLDYFNLVGNPFAAYLNLGDFFTDNAASGILSEATAWFWNQNTNTYEPKTANINGTFEIAPGQGFFLSAGSASTTVTFDAADLSHQNTDAFQKNTDQKPQIKLFINDGTNLRSTRIFYIEDTTTGYDGTIFQEAANSFQVYSQLVTDDQGEKLGVQVLPDSGYEEMIIPLGVTALAGKELSFYSEFLNLTSGIHLYLEDRFTNTFVPLETNNDNFKVTLNEALHGIGRFYLHTSSNALSNNEKLSLTSIKVFKSGAKTLKLVGLPNSNSNLKLYTIQGKEVFNSSIKESGTKEISLTDLATGIYLIELETVYGKINKKIVLN